MERKGNSRQWLSCLRAVSGSSRSTRVSCPILISITVFRGDLEPALFKQLPDDTKMELAIVNGEAGIWISGEPHTVFFLDQDGRAQEARGRLTGNSLLWEMGALTLRIEGVATLERALEIAESFDS